ncbi:MAG TPA: hypothetical protein VMK32_06010 [Burkholderiaceae bacterium]|nr:hypothetical protein [Burkholderiaceae bacterium]
MKEGLYAIRARLQLLLVIEQPQCRRDPAGRIGLRLDRAMRLPVRQFDVDQYALARQCRGDDHGEAVDADFVVSARRSETCAANRQDRSPLPAGGFERVDAWTHKPGMCRLSQSRSRSGDLRIAGAIFARSKRDG